MKPSWREAILGLRCLPAARGEKQPRAQVPARGQRREAQVLDAGGKVVPGPGEGKPILA